ncbi:MAG: dihydrolipoamide dehydrogenase [Hyphomicrobiaceae bacterium]|jgi:dihydrolipoamide dehydrogenase
MSDKQFDLVIIGAGPAGYTAAVRASQLGMQVCLIEKGPTLGGTCLNIGCIPSKALLESSELYFEASHSFEQHGVSVEGLGLDLQRMLGRKTDIVDGLTKGIAGLMKKHKVEVVQGLARIANASTVIVAGEDGDREIAAAAILVCTGSSVIELPSLPFDGKHIISSTEALSLSVVPARMLVVGGGAIGLEMGSVWSRLGSDVTIVEFMEQIVPGADKKIAKTLERSLTKQGMKFKLGSVAGHATVNADGIAVTVENRKKGSKEELKVDVVLVAVGRRANTDGLGLEAIGIETDERGRINVDENYSTNIEGIYAVGDVIKGPMLAHKAEDEAVACCEILAGQAGHVNYAAIPSVVYTWPELASVGMTQAAAEEAGHKVKVGSFPFQANARARCMAATDGLVQMVADATTDAILGVHIVGTGASELIAEAAVAMEFGASAEDIARSTHAHPTLAETIKEAALAVAGRTLNI